MVYYHGTNKDNKKNILKNGFIPSYGRFGVGVYFSSNLEEAKNFGSEVCKAIIPKESIKEIYYPTLISIYPDLAIDEEEGVPALREYILSLGYLAVAIEYVTGEVELSVYDTNIIEIEE